MKRRNASISVLVMLLASGCFNTATVRYAVDDVIWTPHSDFGRTFLKKHAEDFRAIVSNVQESPQLSRVATIEKAGLLLIYKAGDAGDTTYYLGVHLTCSGIFNTLRTTYQSRAASAYSSVLFPLAAILTKHESLFGQDEARGVNLWLDWKATDFLSDQYRLYGQTEGMNAWIPDTTLFGFAKMEISIQELARQSAFTSTMGRTELDFSSPH
jgi:hypothetical protein